MGYARQLLAALYMYSTHHVQVQHDEGSQQMSAKGASSKSNKGAGPRLSQEEAPIKT